MLPSGVLVASRAGRPEGVTLYGHRIKEQRRALGLTQGALADLSRLSVRTVRTAEQGEPVSADTARCLSATLRLAYVELVRPSPQVVRRQLEARGLAPVRLREPFRPVPVLQELDSALGSNLGGVICVDGPRGVGKATLIRHRLNLDDGAHRDGVIWVTASRLHDRPMLERLMVEIADALGFVARLPDPGLVAPEAFDVAFCRQFWAGERLLVLADLEDPSLLQPFSADGSPTVVVSTARRWIAETVADRRIEVAPWPDDAILELLRERSGHQLTTDEPATRELLELIGGLPLYAHLVASGLQSRRYRRPDDFLARVRRARSDAGSIRDPLVRSLVGTIHDDLEPGTRDTLAELSVAGNASFSVPFVSDVLGIHEDDARRTLEDLADAYLLQPLTDSDEAPRFRLAEWAKGSCGSISKQGIERLVQATTARLLDADEPPQATYERLLPALALLDTVMAHLLEHLQSPSQAAQTPDELPTNPPVPCLRGLPALLVALGSVIRYAPPKEAGAWLTAALSLAQDDTQRSALGWMLGWWWMRVHDRAEVALGWARWAQERAHDADTRTSLALHAGILARRATGFDGAQRPWEKARAWAEDEGTSAAQRACATLHAGVTDGFVDGITSGCVDHCDAALDLAGSIEDARGPILMGAAALDATCFRLVLGTAIPREQASQALEGLLNRLRPEPTLWAGMAEVVRHAQLSVEVPVLDAGAHYLALSPADAEAALAHLTTVLTQLGCEGTGLHRDARRHGDLELASFDISGWPLSHPPGIAFPMVLPLGDIRELVLREREALLHFVRAHREEEHALVRALQGL